MKHGKTYGSAVSAFTPRFFLDFLTVFTLAFALALAFAFGVGTPALSLFLVPRAAPGTDLVERTCLGQGAVWVGLSFAGQGFNIYRVKHLS